MLTRVDGPDLRPTFLLSTWYTSAADCRGKAKGNLLSVTSDKQDMPHAQEDLIIPWHAHHLCTVGKYAGKSNGQGTTSSSQIQPGTTAKPFICWDDLHSGL